MKACVMAATLTLRSCPYSICNLRLSHASDKERLTGAWHLEHINSLGHDGKPVDDLTTRMLIYARDGHMSVQLMYPKTEKSLSNEYVEKGYEASFGSYDVDDAKHVLTHHVQGSNNTGLACRKGPSARLPIHRRAS